MEDAFVLIHEKKVTNVKDLVPILEKVVERWQTIDDHRRRCRRGSPLNSRDQQDSVGPSKLLLSKLPVTAIVVKPCCKTSPRWSVERPSSKTSVFNSKTCNCLILVLPRRLSSTKTTPPSSKVAVRQPTSKHASIQIRRELENSTSRLRPREARRANREAVWWCGSE